MHDKHDRRGVSHRWAEAHRFTHARARPESCASGEVGSKGAADLTRDEAFEAADGFFRGFAFGDAPVDVLAGRRRAASRCGGCRIPDATESWALLWRGTRKRRIRNSIRLNLERVSSQSAGQRTTRFTHPAKTRWESSDTTTVTRRHQGRITGGRCRKGSGTFQRSRKQPRLETRSG